MSYPLSRERVTHDDLCRLPPDGKRYELFDGRVRVMPSTRVPHQRVLQRLFLSLTGALPEGAELFIAPMDVIFAPDTCTQPDLVVVLERNRAILQDWIRGAPDLVVEVLSPSTARIDRGLKKKTYARFGVPEYWIVDPETAAIEVHRLEGPSRIYRLAATFRPGEIATTPLLPGLAADVARVFAA